jgi:hypothetical protein
VGLGRLRFILIRLADTEHSKMRNIKVVVFITGLFKTITDEIKVCRL